MTPALPATASFSELVATALRAATERLAEGSRRNAREALEARAEQARQGLDTLSSLVPPAADPAARV